LPLAGIDRLSAATWSVVQKTAGLNVRRHCMHCLKPACASVCPVGALHKISRGPVVYDESKCIGCRYCMLACPFGIPKYEWNSAHPRVRKCFMCYETRIKKGKQPACTMVCPAAATVFGKRSDLIIQARQRIRKNTGRYVERIYGLKEAGGTSVLYVSSVPFERLALPTKLDKDPYPQLTWSALSKIPNIAAIGGILMAGTWWIIRRRIKIQREKEQQAGRSGHDTTEEEPEETEE
jgi:formate dehydrogenase iron-sulfur subunit